MPVPLQALQDCVFMRAGISFSDFWLVESIYQTNTD